MALPHILALPSEHRVAIARDADDEIVDAHDDRAGAVQARVVIIADRQIIDDNCQKIGAEEAGHIVCDAERPQHIGREADMAAATPRDWLQLPVHTPPVVAQIFSGLMRANRPRRRGVPGGSSTR